MGLESANYLYVSDGETSRRLPDLLSFLGARPADETGRGRYVYHGPEFLIEILVPQPDREDRSQISIRVALVNPVGVGRALKTLLKTIFAHGESGYLLDMQTKRKWRKIDDTTWSDIWDTFTQRREEFRKRFGDFEAPISADDVFRVMREQKDNRSRGD
jgi:hypothetical protein